MFRLHHGFRNWEPWVEKTALLIADFGGFLYLMLRNSDPLIEKTLFIFIVDLGGFAYTKGPN